MKPRCPECNLLHIHRPSCSRSPFAPIPGRADAGIDLDIAEAIKPGSTLAHNIGRADADITPTPRYSHGPNAESVALVEEPRVENFRSHDILVSEVDEARMDPDHPLRAAAYARAAGWVNAAENPKESAGREKVSFGGTFPAGALVPVARVFQVGAEKYGRLNWRTAGIQVTTYESAVMRHLLALMDGQDVDPESGQSHWAHIAAGAMIVLDATGLGKVANDRPAPGSAAELLAALAPGRRSPR